MIEVLKDEVARKIAAGEVIDRPYAVTRELLDNAIDAGAKNIEVSLKKGGIGETRVTDNGTGMTQEDLRICFLPHATSKIHETEDLYTIHTLGFRGEALSSIAATSRLEIISKTESAESAYKLTIREGEIENLSPCRGKTGTTVSSKELFYSIPGRRRFLKTHAAEANLSRNIFIEKALPFPEISFRLFIEDKPKLLLTPSNLKERVLQAFPDKFEPAFLVEGEEGHTGFSFRIILGTPELLRRDRRYLYTFVNNRRVQEYSLVQALEYGYKDYLPGGSHPVGFVFISVDPEYVDFNIHPAKKEVRFRNLPEVHHRLVGLVQNILSQKYPRQGIFHKNNSIDSSREPTLPYSRPPLHHESKREKTRFDFPYHEISRIHGKGNSQTPYSSPSANQESVPVSQVSESALGKSIEESSFAHTPQYKTPQYKGQIFSLFLLAEYEHNLYIIDQHAAHERIIYNELKKQGKKQQPLLFPLEFSLEEDEYRCFHDTREAYTDLGFTFREKNPQRRIWEITSIPSFCENHERIIIEYLRQQRGKPENLEQELLSEIACKKAVKEGEEMDHETGRALVRAAMDLPQPRCPHGRPIWYVLSEADLYSFVSRD